jgi:hypothetical protein
MPLSKHIALLLCTALLPGCAVTTGPGAHAGDPYMVNAGHTPFYSYGPSQPNGPDMSLPRGTRLTMLSYEYGFSHIAIEGAGQAGYVATEDIGPTTPAPKPRPIPARRRRIMEESPYPPPAREETIPLPVFEDTLPPPNAPPFRY